MMASLLLYLGPFVFDAVGCASNKDESGGSSSSDEAEGKPSGRGVSPKPKATGEETMVTQDLVIMAIIGICIFGLVLVFGRKIIRRVEKRSRRGNRDEDGATSLDSPNILPTSMKATTRRRRTGSSVFEDADGDEIVFSEDADQIIRTDLSHSQMKRCLQEEQPYAAHCSCIIIEDALGAILAAILTISLIIFCGNMEISTL